MDILPAEGDWFDETLATASPDVLREMVVRMAQMMMDAEVEQRCGAGYGEVSDARVNSRNGYRRREWDTRAGTVELAIPKLRHGSYYPFGGEGAQVFTAAAALTEMAGWMAHDAGDDARARRHFGRARDLSSMGEDRQLKVHVLASLAHVAHHLAQPDDAIGHAAQGQQELTVGASHPELAARLWALQARGHAARGRSRETRALLGLAETALQGSHGAAPSPWVPPFDAASLAGDAARCMRQLGDLHAAQRHAQRVLQLRPAGRARSRAFGHLTLAGVLIERGELDHACTVATDVLHATGSLGSHLVIQRLRDLRDQLHPHRATACARDVLDHLAEALRQREWLYQLTTDITEPRTGPTP